VTAGAEDKRNFRPPRGFRARRAKTPGRCPAAGRLLPAKAQARPASFFALLYQSAANQPPLLTL
jgi:hypothetical protein